MKQLIILYLIKLEEKIRLFFFNYVFVQYLGIYFGFHFALFMLQNSILVTIHITPRCS